MIAASALINFAPSGISLAHMTSCCQGGQTPEAPGRPLLSSRNAKGSAASMTGVAYSRAPPAAGGAPSRNAPRFLIKAEPLQE